jgi:hypothetical protein
LAGVDYGKKGIAFFVSAEGGSEDLSSKAAAGRDFPPSAGISVTVSGIFSA